jgi:hypothetical protein
MNQGLIVDHLHRLDPVCGREPAERRHDEGRKGEEDPGHQPAPER